MADIEIDPADLQDRICDPVIESQHRIDDLSGGRSRSPDVFRPVGVFWHPAPIAVFFDGTGVFFQDFRIREVFSVIAEGQNYLICEHSLFKKTDGGGIRHFPDNDPCLFITAGARQYLTAAEGPGLGNIGFDQVDGTGLPPPGMVDQKLGIYPEQVVEEILVPDRTPRYISHGKHAVPGQTGRISPAHTPEIRDRTMSP